MEKYIFVSGLLAVLLSCGNVENSDSSEQTQFSINSELLGSKIEISALDVSFCPPANWNMNDSIKEIVKTQIRLVDGNVLQEMYLLQLFYNDRTQSVLSIMDISELGITNLDSLRNIYEVQAIETSKTEEAVSLFEYNGLSVVQYIIQQDVMVNFKLLFFNNNYPLLQADYFIQKNNYENTKKSLEASVGSFKFDDN